MSDTKSDKTTAKTLYVHVKTGTAEEVIRESKSPKKGWHIAFSGTAEECAKFVSR